MACILRLKVVTKQFYICTFNANNIFKINEGARKMFQVSAAIVFLRVIRETSRFMLSTPKLPRPLWKAHHQGPTTTVRRFGVVTAPSA